ncbi:hypothetical protein HON52_04585 [Candidatus Uhrbacteria bacterium]|nr:hypothetical protein [Candidatus Uhrbacteria bacterium]
MSDELPTTPKRSRKGIIVLAILSLPALVFLVLAIFFWSQSNAGQDRVDDLEETVGVLQDNINEYEAIVKEESEEAEERDSSEVTYLHQMVIDAGHDLCTDVYEQIDTDTLDEGYYSFGGLTPAALLDEGVYTAIAPELVVGAGWTQVYYEKMSDLLDRYESRLIAQCNFDNRLYSAFLDDSSSLRMLVWNPEELITNSRFVVHQPIGGITDTYFSMYGDLTGNGYPVVSLGYGDAGWSFWEYYSLDSSVYTSDFLEGCTAGPASDDEGNSIEGREIICGREYIPDDE